MQEPVGQPRRNFSRGARASTIHPALAGRPRPTPRRVAGGSERCGAGVPGPDRRRRRGGATVNRPTTRCTPPAAAPRTGPWGVALPHDPGLNAILADPGLGATAKLIVVALVKNWAWVKDHAWPSDETIAARIGKSSGHVQRCLRELEE